MRTDTVKTTETRTITQPRTLTTTATTQITAPPPPLLPPSSLRAVAADYGYITLSWQDNSIDEEGFILERSEDGKSFTSVGRTPANAASYTDRAVQKEKTYYYRVKAFRGSLLSSPSNTVVETATPHGLPISNYFGGLGELETAAVNAIVRPAEFADIFYPTWNWRPYPQGSLGAEAQPSIDFEDYVSGAGSQKIVIKRSQPGEPTTLTLISWKVESINPAYAAFYPRPGDTIVFTFHYKTSTVVENIEFSVVFRFFVKESTGVERHMTHQVLKTTEPRPFWNKISYVAVVPENYQWFVVDLHFTCVKTCSGTFWLDNFVVRTEPEKRLPLIGKDRINFKLAAHHNELWMTDKMELAQKFDLLLGGDDNNVYVKGLKPQLVSLLYFNDPSLVSGWRNDSNNPPCMQRWEGPKPVYRFVPFSPYEKIREEWLLSASSPSRYPRIDGRGHYVVREMYCEFLVDIGREDVIEAAIKSIEKRHLLAGFRNPLLSPVLFHDNFANFYYLWGMQGEPPEKYRDRETRFNVQLNLHQRMKAALLDPVPTRKITANIGVYGKLEFETLQRLEYDGVLIEYFTRIFDRTFAPSLLYQMFTALKNYPEDKIVILIDYLPKEYIVQWNENPSQAPAKVRQEINFILAAFYLVNKPNIYITLRDSGLDYHKSYIIEDFYLPLGKPLGSLEVVEGDENNGALFIRRYSNGIIILNTAETSRAFTYRLDGQYRDRAGNTYSGQIVVPPQTGFVLIKTSPATSPAHLSIAAFAITADAAYSLSRFSLERFKTRSAAVPSVEKG
ncbi:MAG: fibronectin type III domain-containing protein [Candidatus Caldarchaeum sp.]|nr:fibronectin type III domain-containing protein [Candidatus Caldarchaeum sp.]